VTRISVTKMRETPMATILKMRVRRGSPAVRDIKKSDATRLSDELPAPLANKDGRHR
jgi:hypothetical protein